jgi:hypothetical protein
MKLIQCLMLGACASLAAIAHAQTPAPDAPPAARSAQPYLPPALRKPLGAGSVLLRYQSMQKLKKRFDAADIDGSGTLTRDEARRAGLSVVDKNFDHIDTRQRGDISFDDLQSYLMQRREEAVSR